MIEAEIGGGCEVDPVEEIRLRTWARKNYAPTPERDDNWHPVVLDEMNRKDSELVGR